MLWPQHTLDTMSVLRWRRQNAASLHVRNLDRSTANAGPAASTTARHATSASAAPVRAMAAGQQRTRTSGVSTGRRLRTQPLTGCYTVVPQLIRHTTTVQSACNTAASVWCGPKRGSGVHGCGERVLVTGWPTGWLTATQDVPSTLERSLLRTLMSTPREWAVLANSAHLTNVRASRPASMCEDSIG